MSKSTRSGSVRVACLAIMVALGSMGRALAQTSYVVEDLGALAGDTSSVAWSWARYR